MHKLLERLNFNGFDPRISRRNLSYFYAAAVLGNFTQAAKACGVAQPSLSRGIVLLETATDTVLFDRLGRSVELTEKGRNLVPLVELYLNQSIDFVDRLNARQTGSTKEIKVAAISSLTADFLPKLINKFETAHGNMTVSLMDGINPDIVRAVDVGDVDLGIVSTQEDPRRFVSRRLLTDQFCLVVNSTHRFHGRETVGWEELANEEIVTFEQGSSTYDAITSAFREIGLYFQPRAEVRFRNTLMGLVRHRGLAAILPKLVVHEGQEIGVFAIPLVTPIVNRSYYLIERKERFKKEETGAFEAFLRFELTAGGLPHGIDMQSEMHR